MKNLTEKRAADRAKMAKELRRVAVAAGATVTDERPLGARELRLKISVPHGPYVGVEFDGDSIQPDCFVLTWNVETDSLFAFSGLDVNPYHHAKWTRICHGFDDLCATVADDIAALMDGRRYSPDNAAKRARDRRERLQHQLDYIAPIVARGEGIGTPGEPFAESADELRAIHDTRLPTIIGKIDSFIAAGCPAEMAAGIPWN